MTETVCVAPRERVLDDRLLEFAVGVGRFVKALPADSSGRHLAIQLLKSGTAPMAHYAEATEAESWRDYVHKMKIGLKELRETMNWLRYAHSSALSDPESVSALTKQCDTLIAIHVSCINTARHKRKGPHPKRPKD